MSKILDIYISVFLVNSESVLLLALVKYIFFSHFSSFWYFLEVKNPCFMSRNYWKSSCICVFILSKKCRNWFYNSGMVGRRKLPDLSLNRIFNAISIGVQYTLSFQWTNFGLMCLLDVYRDKRRFNCELRLRILTYIIIQSIFSLLAIP